MATPIQYTPQPIFSNIGVLQQQLAQDQARHDLAIQQQAAMEDMFAEIPTHPVDIPIKNKVLGDFQSKVEEIVDRYGGDYGAAAKDIARLTSRTRQNPFFQLAPERRRLAEEERKARLKFGPGYIPLGSVTDKPLQDPTTGEWISPEDLQYDYVTRGQLSEIAQDEFSDIMNRVDESGWYQDQQYPWLLKKNVTRGALESEVPELTNRISETLLRTKPELANLAPEQLMDLSSNLAREMVLGTRTEERQNAEYLANLGKEQDSTGRPVYQRFTGNITESDALGNIQSEAETNINRVSSLETAKSKISNLTELLDSYDIAPTVKDSKVSTTPIRMDSSTRQSINKIKNGVYSISDLKNKWAYNIKNALTQAVDATDQYISKLSPAEENKRFEQIRNIVSSAFLNREQNPEQFSRMLSVLGEEHELVSKDPRTGLLTFSDKGIDFWKQGRENELLIEIETELKDGISKYRDILKKEGEALKQFIEKNPVVTEAMEALKQNNPNMDDITVAQTAIQAASNHKQKQAATHFTEIDIYDDELANNTYRRIKASSGEMPAVQIEDDGGQDDVNLKEVLSDNVKIIDMRFIPGENMIKITTNEPEDNNYKLDATNSKLLPKEAVDTQKQVEDFLQNLRNLTFDNDEEGFKPKVIVDGIPYSAIKAYDPQNNEFVTSIISVDPNNPNQVIPITEGEFLTRYVDSMTRRLGYQRKRQAERVQ